MAPDPKSGWESAGGHRRKEPVRRDITIPHFVLPFAKFLTIAGQQGQRAISLGSPSNVKGTGNRRGDETARKGPNQEAYGATEGGVGRRTSEFGGVSWYIATSGSVEYKRGTLGSFTAILSTLDERNHQLQPRPAAPSRKGRKGT
ncbi:hypothetical protein FA13DRAFT_1883087 [Coprinellus micaceus]|uniref:Uncharacterized protein n=1 Tax=Coprinellus micaceus TaxID=71717 RepID=A0A4Y7T013_COPMI|nr:hypothetical protein FA13DRAFT_1883087 [Coprinellus micaceus]